MYFNRFAGIRSGDGEFSGGLALLAGILPYRDYYTAGPPLNQIKSAIELMIFGKALIVTRAAAVVERLGIAALLYLWLRRTFSRWAAAVASLATIILSAADHTDPLASYNHDAILFAMLCGFAAVLALEAKRSRRFLLLAVASGVAAGLSSLTKQTAGLGTTIAVLVIGGLACAGRYGPKRTAGWLSGYVAGFAFPVLLLGAYLHHLGVLHACLRMLFISGPRAKASHPFAFATRASSVAVDNPAWVIPGLTGVIFSGRVLYRSIREESRNLAILASNWLWLVVVGVLLLVTAKMLSLSSLEAVRDSAKCAVYYTLIATAVFGVLAIIQAARLKGPLGLRAWQIAVFAAVGWSVAITLSLSWPAFEAMLLPGFGLLLAALLDASHRRGSQFVLVVLAALLFLGIWEKLNLPFSFDHQDEPAIRFAVARSAQPMLRGMKLPRETVRLLDETAAQARQHNMIFTYPEMGLIYPLTGKASPTWAGSQNIDVISDDFARQEAARIEHARPAVILYARPTEADLKSEERIWREGQPSGQRNIVAVLDRLVARYRLVDTFVLRDRDNPIRLYVDPDATAVNPDK